MLLCDHHPIDSFLEVIAVLGVIRDDKEVVVGVVMN